MDRAAAWIGREADGRRLVAVSDARVARTAARPLLRALRARGARPLLLTFPAGERSKTRETKALLEDRLLAAGVGRDALVVAIGGGVTGDLAGFLAATWQRGVPVVQVPTTLMAMVDAALGGKTGVDLPGGKNLVGAFHPPVALFADVALLDSLPERDFRAGLAEAVKTAALFDPRLLRTLERDGGRLLARERRVLLEVVVRCLRWKGRVVEQDPHDVAGRALLNFGHTVAHAIEAASGYGIRHGEAVAMGLVVEARLAERLTGLPRSSADRIEALLSRLGLPVRIPRRLTPRRLAQFARNDKKSRRGILRCALPARLGAPPPRQDPSVPVDRVRDFLPALRQN